MFKDGTNNMSRVNVFRSSVDLIDSAKATSLVQARRAKAEFARIDLLFVRSVRARLIVILMFVFAVTAQVGCGEKPKTRPVRRQASLYSTEPIDIYLGPTGLRVPWNMLSWRSDYSEIFVGHGPFNMNEIDMSVSWPDLKGEVLEYGSNARTKIIVKVLWDGQPVPPFLNPEDVYKREIERRYVIGPIATKKSGIDEWRPENREWPVIFAVRHPRIDNLGFARPMVRCEDLGKSGIVRCAGVGVLMPSLRYSYTTLVETVPEWQDMDAAVRELISSMMIRGK